jgi:L-aspartate oxidase
MSGTPAEADFIVIGAGVAGLRAAIELAPWGTVVVVAKREVTDSNTQWAQGGIAAALSDEDEISLHLQDTLVAGDGLSNPRAAKVLVEDAPARIEELIQWGTEFDRQGTRLTFGREGAHSRNRILHAHGDSTGREILRALYAKSKTLANISVCEFEFSTDLILASGRIAGIRLIGERGAQTEIRASAVLLATGGMGQLYRNTTNPTVATGDGVAMAFRAGAELSDMEFIQFHPTALYLENAPRFLLSEALRGEGAYLRNRTGARFMTGYHALAELAPRDVVARAITEELEHESSAHPVVYLDLTHLSPEKTRARFPRIYETCLQYHIDIACDPIPVRPAAHYAMGGVRTDLEGRATVPGLYAAGEAASTGVHGANRLASNSLLEGLVFGARAGQAMRQERGDAPTRPAGASPPAAGTGLSEDRIERMVREIQDFMWTEVGIVRSREGLRSAIGKLEELGAALGGPGGRRAYEALNLQQAGWLVARAAVAREESRGAHYRSDFPHHDDAHFLRHSVLVGDRVSFVADQ